MGKPIVEKIVTGGGYITDSEGGKKFIAATADDPEVDKELHGVVSKVDAIVLHAATFAAFAGHYPDADPAVHLLTDLMNSLPEHVVSDTLTGAAWGAGQASIEGGNSVEVLRSPKARYAGDIILMGRPGLSDSALVAGLVDILHIRLLPVIIGAGGQRFTPSSLGAMPVSRSIVRSP